MIFPEQSIVRASRWCYSGVWRFVTRGLRVPDLPPELSGAQDADIRSFRPADGFLRYLKFHFWIWFVIIDTVLFIGWIILLISSLWIGLLLTIPIWAIMLLPDIVAYVAIHLRFDTTWYVFSDRSLRIRRGIWEIHETTITYENIQNVSIRQGPLQRYFGIADVVVETAGGGGTAGKGEHATASGHLGMVEGISNADEIRKMIVAKWQSSTGSGLGDEPEQVHLPSSNNRPSASVLLQQAELLEEIRDLTLKLTG
jgi:membrane protein YdbS with pleckstrin-like domain